MNRYRFHCRVCGTLARPSGENETDALRLLREFDWQVTPDPDPSIPLERTVTLCPECRAHKGPIAE